MTLFLTTRLFVTWLVVGSKRSKEMNSMTYDFKRVARKALLLLAASASFFTTNAQAGSVYAFAEQKIYNMTMTSVGSGSNLTNGTYNILTNTSASLSGYQGVSYNAPAIDATQSYLGSAPAPVENLSTNAVNPSSQIVLAQFNSTPAGSPNSITPNLPSDTDLTQPNFSRSDVVTRVPPSTPLSPAYLFTPGYGPGNVAIDSAAEALLTTGGLGSSSSGWTLNGSFTLTSADQVRLSFEFINRLVALSNLTGQVASAVTSFQVFITEQAFPFNTVFQPLAKNYQLSFPLSGSSTLNINGIGNQTTYTSSVLAAGNYGFTITGSTNVNVTVVPEPSSYVMLGLGLVTISGLRFRRKLLSSREMSE